MHGGSPAAARTQHVSLRVEVVRPSKGEDRGWWHRRGLVLLNALQGDASSMLVSHSFKVSGQASSRKSAREHLHDGGTGGAARETLAPSQIG